jgi:hypothetical protein
MTDNWKFPQFRKNAFNTSYFKIIDENTFIEIQIIGNKNWEHKITANQFPEKLLIKDMLACRDNLWQIITEDEFLKNG